MIILFSILNLDIFLIISPRLYSYFTTKQDLFIQKYIYFLDDECYGNNMAEGEIE